MSSRRVSPLAMGVNPLLLLKETEECDQPREAKRSWENATPQAIEYCQAYIAHPNALGPGTPSASYRKHLEAGYLEYGFGEVPN